LVVVPPVILASTVATEVGDDLDALLMDYEQAEKDKVPTPKPSTHLPDVDTLLAELDVAVKAKPPPEPLTPLEIQTMEELQGYTIEDIREFLKDIAPKESDAEPPKPDEPKLDEPKPDEVVDLDDLLDSILD